MARRRRYGDIVALPLGGVMDTLKSSAKGTDLLVGALVGVLGYGGFNWLKNQSWFPLAVKTNPQFVRFSPVLAGAAVATAVYFADKKVLKMPGKATGHAIGAFATGLVLQALQEIKLKYPTYFADIVDLRLAGLLVNDPARLDGFGGLLVDDPTKLGAYADNPRLADLAALSMGLDVTDSDQADIGLDA